MTIENKVIKTSALGPLISSEDLSVICQKQKGQWGSDQMRAIMRLAGVAPDVDLRECRSTLHRPPQK